MASLAGASGRGMIAAMESNRMYYRTMQKPPAFGLFVVVTLSLIGGCGPSGEQGDEKAPEVGKKTAPKIANKGPQGNATPIPLDEEATSNEGEGSESTNDKEPNDTDEKPTAAARIFHEMRNRYAAADEYSDDGELVFSYRLDGVDYQDRAPFSVQFVRPNRVKVEAYKATVVCDGDTIRASIADAPSRNFDDQIVERPAPAVPTLADLVGGNAEVANDPILFDMISGGKGGPPIQLKLLLGDPTFETFDDLELKKPAKVDGHACHRIEISRDGEEGSYIVSIDEETHLLRRLELPAIKFSVEEAEDPEAVASLAAHFANARFSSREDSKFELTPPADAKLVQRFVRPPQPLPSDMFGKLPGDFTLYRLDETQLRRDALTGRVTVLTWFQNHPACASLMPALETVFQQFKDNPDIAFWVIAAEPESIKNEQIAKLLQTWGVNIPPARDLQAVGEERFHIEALPAVVVLDARGVVQFVDLGFNPRLKETLPEMIRRVAAGEDLAKIILASFEQEMKDYQRELAASAVGSDASGTVIELPEARIAPRSEPDQLNLTELYHCDEIKSPGNLHAFVDGAAQRLAVVDGGTAVVVLDGAGKIVQRHEPKLPEGSAFTYLRSALGPNGKRWFVASTKGGPRLFLFDDKFALKLVYPDAGQRHRGLGDVQFADLDCDGTPEIYAGYWDIVGVQRVSLTGRREWSNRRVANVGSLALPIDPSNQKRLFVTSDRGSIAQLDTKGEQVGSMNVPGVAISELYTAPATPGGGAVYCGLSYGLQGGTIAIGLNAALEEEWRVELAPGMRTTPIEPVAAGPIFAGERLTWALPGPDGSIGFVSASGELSDGFDYGEALTGIAVTTVNGQRVLVVATAKGVRGFRVKG
jgi:hypothetical protein